MPTYDYECDDGHIEEVTGEPADDPSDVCPRDDCDAPADRLLCAPYGRVEGGTRKFH